MDLLIFPMPSVSLLLCTFSMILCLSLNLYFSLFLNIEYDNVILS